MKIEVNLEKKSLLVILAAILIIAGAIVVYAYTNIPNPGHGGDSVVVKVGDTEMTLQEAIDNSKLGGTGNFVNGSGIVFTQVAGKTMVNSTFNKVTGITLYSCPLVDNCAPYETGCGSARPIVCTGQITTSSSCGCASGCNVNWKTCNPAGYLVQ